ncbi:hypothetical protein VTJ49DRAFT_6604 [Mycothermus thermophilus]|uniref:F-box domain-containing protein n=1 Tax=Humicola insolens TaxID=85995 RepID=A0ABR3VJV1_HUMIN
MAQFLAAVPLPTEVLQLIVRELDPIALIALSQTSKAWRAFIRPIRHDFEQRLLALELHPDYGGLVPNWDEYYQKLTPPWDSPEWKTTKYACCGCMKLLTHMMFDNHAILRRHWRKPSVGSVEANKALRTDWEPFEPALRWQRIQDRARQAREAQRRWRRILDWRRDYLLTNPPTNRFEHRALSPTAEEGDAFRRLIGTDRRRRRCVECQRLSGRWGYPRRSRPAVANSRQLKFQSVWERFVPGLLEQLTPDRFPDYWRCIRESSDGVYLTLRVAWCDECCTWQEWAAFRDWRLYGPDYRAEDSFPPLEHVCVKCAVRPPRDQEAEARRVQNRILTFLRDSDTAWRLGFGWRWVREDLNNQPDGDKIRTEVLDGLTLEKGRPGYLDQVVVEESNIPDLRRRLLRYRDFVYNEVDEETRNELVSSWFKLWLDQYERLEEVYFLQKRLIQKLEKEPKLILNYMLERDPYYVGRASYR